MQGIEPHFDRFGRIARESVAKGEIAGAVAAVATRELELVRAYGLARQADAAPMERDAIFRIASCAKAFHAATALAVLHQEGIDFDQPIAKWIPELAEPRVLRDPLGEIGNTVALQRPISIWDVLTFQLGTGMYLGKHDTPHLAALRAAGVAPQTEPVELTPDEFIARLGALPLAHQPGEAFMYHLGDDVLRVLMRRITGQPWHEVLQERLCRPLGLGDTGTSVPRAKHHRFTTAYFTGTEPGQPLKAWDEPNGRFAAEPLFPNQINSTARDFLTFTTMLLNEGEHQGRRILPAEWVRLMMTDHLTPAMKAVSPAHGLWETRGWGMGGTVYTRGSDRGPNAGSYSWFGGYGPHFLVDPVRGSSTIILVARPTTSYDDTQFGYRFEAETYTDILYPA
jgi:CubicO group peptidase (beta-lactamase class C family)